LSVAKLQGLGLARVSGLAALALLAGCTPKPKLPPGVTPTVSVGEPLKSEGWKAVSTAADENRIARLGLAWQEALADARKSFSNEIRAEGVLLRPRAALPRPL